MNVCSMVVELIVAEMKPGYTVLALNHDDHKYQVIRIGVIGTEFGPSVWLNVLDDRITRGRLCWPMSDPTFPAALCTWASDLLDSVRKQ